MEEMDHFYCVCERQRERKRQGEREISMFDVCKENNHLGDKGVEENVRIKGGAKDKIRESIVETQRNKGISSPRPPAASR